MLCGPSPSVNTLAVAYVREAHAVSGLLEIEAFRTGSADSAC